MLPFLLTTPLFSPPSPSLWEVQRKARELEGALSLGLALRMQPGKLLGYAAPSDASELQLSIAVQTLDGLVCSEEGRKGWRPTDRPAKKWETGAPWNWGNVP